jgi:hypothetical protein
MRILLINNNPVVSRLTALSARKEDIEIDEIQEVTELGSSSYDIVFVDADSWTKDVRDVISENINMKKSVLFYSDGDEDEKDSFDITILKPFLPSEVSAVIRSVEDVVETSSTPTESEENFDILNEGKKSLEDDLFDLDALDDKEEKKEKVVEASKDALVELELSDDSFDNKLAEAFPTSNKSTLDDDLLKDDDKVELTLSNDLITEETKKEEKSKSDKNDDERFNLDLDEELLDLDDDLFNDKKEEKKPEETSNKVEEKDEVKKESSTNELDDFVMDDLVLEPVDGTKEKSSDVSIDAPLELDSVEEAPKEKHQTQILDEVEIAKIKGILTEDTSDEVSLDNLMPLPEKSMQEESKEIKQDDVLVNSDALAKTLTSMPVEALRELLAGAKVNIKIKFPDSRK